MTETEMNHHSSFLMAIKKVERDDLLFYWENKKENWAKHLQTSYVVVMVGL